MPISIINLDFIYGDQKKPALNNISLEIEDGKVLGIIGHTGSGKSTLIQHINGLLQPTSGKIIVSGMDITLQQNKKPSRNDLRERNKKLLDIRRRVGLVFQYPEYQLFEETVAKDIAFGPKNLGCDPEDIDRRVRYAMEAVALDYDEFSDRSPFDMSGGQKRRVAIAGVLAMKPEVLILDEPAAGLDPKGRDDILQKIRQIHNSGGLTTIIVSHSMEDMARMADRVIVLNEGEVALDGSPSDIFQRAEELSSMSLNVPQVTQLLLALKDRGLDVDTSILNEKTASNEILKVLKLSNDVCSGGSND